MALARSDGELLAFGDPTRYDPLVDTPHKVLGYRFGDRLSRHSDIMRYLAVLAESQRAELLPIGRSYEGRALAQFVVSSRDNLDRLESLRAVQQRLADPDSDVPSLAHHPVVVWIMANVHGGEHSGAEAALALAYQLVAGTDSTTRAIRDNAVVVIDPLQNPDGRDRSVNNHYALGGLASTTDRHAAEHRCPWPGARGSHYAFDLNRDWCLLTHPETRARVASFLAWRPQVVADLHEMGGLGGYYFPPPAAPIEANVPDELLRWWEVFGRANAGAFDERGWDYFIGEYFDSYYPGYGESWPLYHGALGMTFEQDTPSTLALRNERDRLVTLAQATERHFVAAYTVCATAAEHRRELLTTYRQIRCDQVSAGLDGARQALLIDAGDRAADAADVAALLRAQGVCAEIAAEPVEVDAEPQLATETGGGMERLVTLAPGSVIVPLAQPEGALVRVLCEPHSPMPREFLATEDALLEGRAEPSIYDITAWSLPHRVGLDAYWSATVPDVLLRPLGHDLVPAKVAYLLPMTTRAAYQATARMTFEDGWAPRMASRPFRFEGRAYDRGTAVLHVGDHDERLPARLAALLAETGCEVVSADRSWDDSGERFSLGSAYLIPVQRPRLAMLTRDPVSPEGAGWCSYLLEQVYRIPHTPLAVRGLTAEILRDYDVLLMPDSSHYTDVFGEQAELLKRWVEAGGTLVALGGRASAYLSDGKGLSGASVIEDLRCLDAKPELAKDAEKPIVPQEHRPLSIPGVSAWVATDPHSYLTYGCPGRMLVPLLGANLFRPTVEGHTACRLTGEAPIGWLPARMADKLDGRAWLWQDMVGAGQVICFAVPPTFRASWPMLDRLWLNAVLYSRSRKRE
ncbi:MAG: hypothetical protein HZB16_08195 [Armatimonadetes bacterium]|nr:hypothetical protein [Armatimonadota bacterium]